MTATLIKERPILFSGPMVRAILEGRKTQTRRVINPQPVHDPTSKMPWVDEGLTPSGAGRTGHSLRLIDCPYGRPGDRLWVREKFCQKLDDAGMFVYNTEGNLDPSCFWYAADGLQVVKGNGDGGTQYRKDGSEASPWRPSIHMPREACRMTLDIVNVRVERLQEIDVAGCRAEGIESLAIESHEYALHTKNDWLLGFSQLWDKLNAKRGYAFDSNPWVWVIEFKRMEAST